MIKNKLLPIILALAILPLVGLSCGQKKSSSDGGIYKSTDAGETWEQKVKIDEKNSLASLSINKVVVDQNDSNVIFAGTTENGIYKSSDAGETWAPTSLQVGGIREIVFNPEDSSVLYVTGNIAGTGKIFKSSDGGNNWEEVYSETHGSTEVNTIAVDWYDPRKVYAGTNVGALLKSTDSGRSWVAIQWFDKSVDRVAISHRDSRKLYVQLTNAIHKSIDEAESFSDLESSLEKFGKVHEVHDLVLHPQEQDQVYFISALGLLRSNDGGKEWQDVPLLSYPSYNSVVSLALDPDDPDIIYLSFDSNLYISVDGGQNWSVKQFTSGKIQNVAVDPSDTAMLYTGILVSGQ